MPGASRGNLAQGSVLPSGGRATRVTQRAGLQQAGLTQTATKPRLASTAVSYPNLLSPPFAISNGNERLPLSTHTLPVTARHRNGLLEYDVHNLYGLSEAVATHKALAVLTGKKPFVLTR